MVKKAIQDAGGNLTRAAALLGCTRQTLYTWIYQLGLERLAGVRMDARPKVDSEHRVDGRGMKENKSDVYSGGNLEARLRLVEQAAERDLPIQASFKCRESVWKRMKIAAIQRGTTLSNLAETFFEEMLDAEEQGKKKGGRQ